VLAWRIWGNRKKGGLRTAQPPVDPGFIELSIRLIRFVRLTLFLFFSISLRRVLRITRAALILALLGLGGGGLRGVGVGGSIRIAHHVLRCSEFAAIGQWHSKGTSDVRQLLEPVALALGLSRRVLPTLVTAE
jgi:hypothetical protein